MRKFTAFTAVGSALLFATSVAYAADGGQVDMPVTVSFTAADKCVPKSISHTIVQLSAAEVTQVIPTNLVPVIKSGQVTLPLDNCPIGTMLKINAGGNFTGVENVSVPEPASLYTDPIPVWGFDGAAAGILGMSLFMPNPERDGRLIAIEKPGTDRPSSTKVTTENQVRLTYSINYLDRLAAQSLRSGDYNATATLIVAIK